MFEFFEKNLGFGCDIYLSHIFWVCKPSYEIRKSFAEVWYFFITPHPKNYSKNITLLRVLLNSRKCDIFLSNVLMSLDWGWFFLQCLFFVCPIFHAWDDKIKFYVNVFIWQQILKIIVASAIWRLAALLSSIFMEALLWSGILVDDDSQSSHFWKVSYQWITEYLALRVLCMQLNSRLRYSLLFN